MSHTANDFSVPPAPSKQMMTILALRVLKAAMEDKHEQMRAAAEAWGRETGTRRHSL